MDKIILFLKASKLTVFNRIETLQVYTNYSRIIKWGKLISITGVAQTVVQVVGFISGILIIRWLPVEEYAYYTLANVLLGSMVVLSDGGITNGVTREYSIVWENKQKAGKVLKTGLKLRRKFAVFSLLFGIPILYFLLIQHNASVLLASLIVLSVIPAFYSSLSAKLYEIPLLLNQKIVPLQKNQLQVNFGRLFILGITLFIFPWAFIAITASGISQVWGNFQLKKMSTNYLDWNQEVDKEIIKKILVFVKKLLPGAVYFCFSGQIYIWLISFFGATSSIAEFGALARLAMILTIFRAVFHTVITPYFIKLQEKREVLLKHYILIFCSLLIISGILLFGMWIFSTQILWILGSNYKGLENELILFLAGSCLEMIVGIYFILNSNRGWLINPYVNIILGVSVISLGIFIFDISNLRGILYFKFFTATISLIYFLSFGYFQILKISKSQPI